MTGTKTSTAIKLTDKESELLVQAQEAGLSRGITLLSHLTYSKKQMAIEGIKGAASIGSAAHTYSKGGSSDTVGSIMGDQAEAQIVKLLNACWDNVKEKLNGNVWLTRACTLLKTGVEQLLSQIKGLIFNGGVLSKLVPFYGNIKGLVDGAILAVKAHGHKTAADTLADMGPAVASGIASSALEGFSKYARSEMLRCAGKSAWTFAKSIGGLLAEVFSFGAASAVSFAIAVVEAISSFVYSLVQALMFDKATKKFEDYATKRTLPSAEEFRTILAGCSFVGCVFFASANYIGHFNMTSVLANTDKVLSTNMLTSTVPKLSLIHI